MKMPIVYHPHYVTPLPPGHRFPMNKFRLIHALLISDGLRKPDEFHCPETASRETIETVHTKEYTHAFCNGTISARAERRIGLPWSAALVRRTRTAIGGSLLTARLALRHGLACNTAGGTHHAFPGGGSGFCIFNDLAIVAKTLLAEQLVERILIMDLDVHQGDATALIFRDTPAVTTFSIHCGANFPFKKQQSDVDISLTAGTDDRTYLDILQRMLPDLLSEVNPDLVLYDAGVDPHRNDALGKLDLSDDGIRQRDAAVIGRCLANRIPVAAVIGGGYQHNLNELAARHSILHRVADQLYGKFRL